MPQPDPDATAKKSEAGRLLTDRELVSLKPKPGRRYDKFDGKVPGLAIRVNRSSKTWVLFYRRHVESASGGWEPSDTQRRWTMGRYPALTLAAAREKAQDALHALRTKGIDPADEKRTVRTGNTFGDLADEYIRRHAKPHKRSWEENQRVLNLDVLPRWKHRPVRSIRRRDVHELIDAIVDRGASVMANRTLGLLSALFNYGVSKDWLDGNPASRIPKQPETSRDRVLTDQELEALWGVLESAKTLKRVTDDAPAPAVTPAIARGLQMLIVTAQRPGEVFRMRWQDVDKAAGWWTIPGQYTKNREPHRVPLTKRALVLLEEAAKASPGNNPWVFAGTQGANVAARAKKAAAALRRQRAIAFNFHRHDLRRTAATGLAQAGIARPTISHVLNHVGGGARATLVYDRYSYDAEKQSALEAWGRRLDAILAGKSERRVVSFKGRDAGRRR